MVWRWWGVYCANKVTIPEYWSDKFSEYWTDWAPYMWLQHTFRYMFSPSLVTNFPGMVTVLLMASVSSITQRSTKRTINHGIWVFPAFDQKIHPIQLIRQEKFKIKKTFLRLEPNPLPRQTYWSTVRHANYYTNKQAAGDRHKKAFSSLQCCLTGSGEFTQFI